MKHQFAAMGLMSLALVACSSGESPSKSNLSPSSGSASLAAAAPVKRWYEPEQLATGKSVFNQNCAACHGKQAEGAPDWRNIGPDGKYPAPPLNGTGHAWHHPLKMLFHVVENGSPGGQGNMPAWGGKLSEDEMIAVIAWFQSNWPEDIYAAWMQRELASRI